LLIDIASSKRLSAGKNASSSITPMRATGGFWINWISAARSRSWPLRHVASMSVESRMCSGS
jgi:hypothetical protein